VPSTPRGTPVSGLAALSRRTVPPLPNRQEIITAAPPAQVGATDRRARDGGGSPLLL